MIQRLSASQYAGIIHELAEPLAASLQLEIWGIEVLLSGRPLVRVYVESVKLSDAETPQNLPQEENATFSEGGVDIEACASLSRLLGLALDVEAETLPDSYILEISSPGLSRPFFSPTQLARYVGQEITCTLYESPTCFVDRRKFTGLVHAVENTSFTLELAESHASAPQTPLLVSIEWANVRKANLIHHFPDTSKPVSPSRGKKATSNS